MLVRRLWCASDARAALGGGGEVGFRLFLGGGQREVEGRALFRRGVGPDAAAVAADDALRGGEADAGALELLDGMQALEWAEELVGIRQVEAGTVVANVEHDLAVAAAATEGDLGGRM